MRRRTFNTAVAAGAAAALTPNTTAAAADGTTATPIQVPVKVGGVNGHIYGALNTPPGATTLQVLVHGWTYNRHYFDAPYKPDTYSYARAANRAGYATLAIDRLGAGCSLHPLSVFDTLDNHVAAIHKTIQAARNGDFGTAFDKVILVGHSLGSIMSATTAGRHPEDIDALITTGYAHQVNALYAFPTIVGRDYLAAGDPQFAAQQLDPLYVSSIPGARYTFYRYEYTNPVTGEYELLNAEQEMVDTDEEFMRATASLTQFATALPTLLINETADLNVPVLAVNGDTEPFFCGAGTATCTSDESIVAFESQYYAAGAHIEGYSVPGTGHDIHLELTSPDASARMIAFCDAQVGAGDGAKNAAPAPTLSCPQPEPIDPPLAACLANRLLTSLVLPVINLYADTVDPLPGMGDGYNPIPVVAEFLTEVNRIITQVVGGLPISLKQEP